MAWYGDVRFKHKAGIEFLGAENVSVTNIHKRLKNTCGVSAVDKSTHTWTHCCGTLLRI